LSRGGRLLAVLCRDPELIGCHGIELARDWQMLRLLIGPDTGSRAKTEHTIDLPAVMSFVQQNLLHLIYGVISIL
jgi:hypothetical protein